MSTNEGKGKLYLPISNFTANIMSTQSSIGARCEWWFPVYILWDEICDEYRLKLVDVPIQFETLLIVFLCGFPVVQYICGCMLWFAAPLLLLFLLRIFLWVARSLVLKADSLNFSESAQLQTSTTYQRGGAVFVFANSIFFSTGLRSTQTIFVTNMQMLLQDFDRFLFLAISFLSTQEVGWFCFFLSSTTTLIFSALWILQCLNSSFLATMCIRLSFICK